MKGIRVQWAAAPGAVALVDDEDFQRLSALCSWRVDAQGYVTSVSRSEQHFRMHREALHLTSGDPIVDHINGDRLDNRKSNLRLSDSQSNALNRAVITNLGTSIYRGVTWHRQIQRWQAKQQLGGKSYYLGVYLTEEEAAAAVAAFRAERGITNGYPINTIAKKR